MRISNKQLSGDDFCEEEKLITDVGFKSSLMIDHNNINPAN
ncbi:MAG: hypothetical protein ABIO55_06640 [Ginsengibacter sp.]